MIEDLLYFIKERHSIYLKKEKGLPKPWTKDEILQTYKFCNVYRELDTVTKWITRKIRGPFSTNRNLWFMLCVARQINWPDTLQELMDKKAWPISSWNPMKACEVMRSRGERGEKLYTGSYMLRGDTPKEGLPNDKPLYTCKTVLGAVWAKRGLIEPNMHNTLVEAHKALLNNHGWGSFLAAQVVADLKYAPQLKNAPDWKTWAASGPGSRRGLNRILGRPVTSPWDEVEWLSRLQDLSRKVAPHVKKWGMPELHNQDLQNVLCEFDKYQRVKLGEGKPRSLYNGKG